MASFDINVYQRGRRSERNVEKESVSMSSTDYADMDPPQAYLDDLPFEEDERPPPKRAKTGSAKRRRDSGGAGKKQAANSKRPKTAQVGKLEATAQKSRLSTASKKTHDAPAKTPDNAEASTAATERQYQDLESTTPLEMAVQSQVQEDSYDILARPLTVGGSYAPVESTSTVSDESELSDLDDVAVTAAKILYERDAAKRAQDAPKPEISLQVPDVLSPIAGAPSDVQSMATTEAEPQYDEASRQTTSNGLITQPPASIGVIGASLIAGEDVLSPIGPETMNFVEDTSTRGVHDYDIEPSLSNTIAEVSIADEEHTSLPAQVTDAVAFAEGAEVVSQLPPTAEEVLDQTIEKAPSSIVAGHSEGDEKHALSSAQTMDTEATVESAPSLPQSLLIADGAVEHSAVPVSRADDGAVDRLVVSGDVPASADAIEQLEMQRYVRDVVMAAVRSPVSPVVVKREAIVEASLAGTRKSGRAPKPITKYEGFHSEVPTDGELGLQPSGPAPAESVSTTRGSTPNPEPKTITLRRTTVKKQTPAKATPKATPKEHTLVQSTPKSSTKSATRVRKPPQTPKSPSKVVAISTVSRLKLANYAYEEFDDTPSVKGNTAKTMASKALPTPPSSQSSQTGLDPLPTVDSDLLSLSQALTVRAPLGSKPDPQGQPGVWADSRQALCETVPYFKKPQGGCHQNDRHVYAFLYDGVGHCREYMDSDLIIARAGGGMESDSTGSMVQAKDQSMTEAQVLAMINDAQLQNPLIVISGDRNTGAPSRMPHKYCVLGWYKPISVWAEKTAGKGKKNWTTIKYRLERLDASMSAWHAPQSAAHFDKNRAGGLVKHGCVQCGKVYPQIYLLSWLCLNPDCQDFWKLRDAQDAPCGALAYNPAFLLDRTAWAQEDEPFSVKPPVPDIGKAIGDNLSYINTRGICCPLCGRCNQRYMFSGWICDNPSCAWEGLKANHRPMLPASLHQPWENFGDGPSLARNKHEPSINVAVDYRYGYKVYTYTFDGIKGCFIHAVANNKINRDESGPDTMLADIQTEDMGLERRRFGGEKMSGKKVETVDKQPATPQRPAAAEMQLPTPMSEELPRAKNAEVTDEPETPAADPKAELETGDFMTAFSMNYGMPYKFVASGASKPFEQAPWPVRACRSRLNWAQQAFLADQTGYEDFNEELIFAYMEGQKIEYHDDGEEGLGPRIATLSLGGKAKMHMRMKIKHYVGCSKGTGLFTAERPVPGGIGGKDMDERRLQAWNELQMMKEVDRPGYQKRLKELPKELGLYEKRNKKADDLVTVTLSHGDIIVMDGYEIQKYLEHKVVPEGYLRFALTCRTVLENHLKPEEMPRYAVGKDEGRYNGVRWTVGAQQDEPA